MVNLTNKNNTNASDNKNNNAGPGKYEDALAQILAKAGKQASAQTPNTSQPQPQQPTAQSSQPQQTAAQPAQPAQPQASVNPQDRLQQILAQAGMTPAQQAQANAQAKVQAKNQQILTEINKLKNGGPSAGLLLEIEWPNGSDNDICLRVHSDAAGNTCYDMSGCDIDYGVPSTFDPYIIIDGTYYKMIPETIMLQELANCKIISAKIV